MGYDLQQELYFCQGTNGADGPQRCTQVQYKRWIGQWDVQSTSLKGCRKLHKCSICDIMQQTQLSCQAPERVERRVTRQNAAVVPVLLPSLASVVIAHDMHRSSM